MTINMIAIITIPKRSYKHVNCRFTVIKAFYLKKKTRTGYDVFIGHHYSYKLKLKITF